MIICSELRRGNWIKRIGGSPFVVEDICENAINIDYGEYEMNGWYHYDEDLEPIPLTPEVLLSCGLKLENRYPNDPYWYQIESCPLEISKECDQWSIGGEIGDIKFLHQLQNLYFALTNTELIYSPV